METLSPDRLADIQRHQLLKQIEYVYAHSEFYRKKFAEHGVKLEHISRLDDLGNLPFTTKEELRVSQERRPPLGDHAAVSLDRVVRVNSSSGTTGRPSYVGITRRDRQIWTEVVSRVYYAEGVRPTSRVAMGFSLGFFVGGLAVHDAVEEIGAALIPVGTGASERLLSAIQDLKADTLTCTPSYASYLAEYAAKKDIDPAALGIKLICCGAEPGGGVPNVAERIGTMWNATVTEGLGNADVLAVYSGQCDQRQGNHFCAQEFIIPEVIDPHTGDRLPLTDGVEGELVCTHIDRECVPLVRFRTGDIVQVWDSPCPCGRTGVRLRCVGRTDDMLILLGVNVFPSAIKDVVGGLTPRTTGEIQVVLHQPGPAVDPPLNIKVEHGANETNLDALKKEIEALLRARLLFVADVELVPAGALPRYEMKAQLIDRAYQRD
jgi:phenylacetate-CoA ligase